MQGIIKLHEFLAFTWRYMVLFKKAIDLHKHLEGQRKNNNKIAFIPTMGALHEGHSFLIRQAKKDSCFTACSIFVNPTQFNDAADFKKYPVTIEKDILLLETIGCDMLFLPSVPEIYPQGTAIKFSYDLGYLETILEGKYRPGHFQGVCAVVHRLLEIVKPDQLYIGQKDYQQCLVIKRLIGLTGLSESVNVKVVPTQREKDGLAMSSRNMRLSAEERKKAPAIYQALNEIKKQLKPGTLDPVKELAVNTLNAKGFKVDYIEMADSADLTLVNEWDGKKKLVALAAAFLGDVRLIDNVLLN